MPEDLHLPLTKGQPVGIHSCSLACPGGNIAVCTRTENFPGMLFEEGWVCGYCRHFVLRTFVVDLGLVAAKVDWRHIER